MSDAALLLWTLPPLWAVPLLVGWGLSRRGVDWGARWWIGHLAVGEVWLVVHALGLPRIVAEAVVAALLLLAAVRLLQAGWERVPAQHGALPRGQNGPDAPSALVRRSIDVVSLRVRSILSRDRPGSARLVAVSILLSLLALDFVEVLAHPTQAWDTLAIWFNKARAIQAWLPLSEVPLPHYPNLGPVLEAGVLNWIGQPNAEPFARLVFPTQYFFWCVHLVSLAPARARWPVPVALALAGWLGSDVAFRNGYQDGFVALCGGLAVSQLLRALRASDAADSAIPVGYRMGLAGWFAGSACLVKNEGAVLAGIVVLGGTLAWGMRGGSPAEPHRQRWRQLLPFWIGAVGMALVWPLLSTWNGLDPRRVQGAAFTVAGVMTAYRNIDRVPEIGSHFAEYLRVHADLLLASAWLGGFAAWYKPGCRRGLALLAGILLAHSLFVGLVFLSTQDSFQWHLENAFFRLMLQHVFVYQLALATAGMSDLERNQRPQDSNPRMGSP